jgi:uncharacterized protein (TIRG00374 family)
MSRKLLVILALVAIVVIVAYASRDGKFDWALFARTIRDLKWGWLSASLVATVVTYWIRAVRWQLLLEPLKKIGVEAALAATLIGFSATYILGRAGEPIGPLWLTRRERVPLSASGATWLVQRFLDLTTLGLVFAATLLFFEIPATEGGRKLGFMKYAAGGFIILLVAGMAAMMYFRANIDRIVSFIPFKRVASFLHSVAQGLSFLHNGRSVAMTFIHSIALWIVIALQFWFMLLALRLDFTFAASNLVMVATAIGSVISIPGVGGGWQIAMAFTLHGVFGVSDESSTAAALVSYALSYIPTVGSAALYMLFTGISLKDLRGLETI